MDYLGRGWNRKALGMLGWKFVDAYWKRSPEEDERREYTDHNWKGSENGVLEQGLKRENYGNFFVRITQKALIVRDLQRKMKMRAVCGTAPYWKWNTCRVDGWIGVETGKLESYWIELKGLIVIICMKREFVCFKWQSIMKSWQEILWTFSVDAAACNHLVFNCHE